VAAKNVQPFSPMHDRYNGFTLGTFASIACHRTSLTEARMRFLRQRVDEFLAEIQAPPLDWQTRGSFVTPDILERLVSTAAARSRTLGDFTALGAMAAGAVVNASLLTRAVRRTLFQKLVAVLERYDVPRLEFERWFRSVTARSGPLDLSMVLSTASVLLAVILEAVRTERDTCFVALPFRRPFLDLYVTLYRPALRRAGFRSIRAWGGVSTEEYAMSLLTLISRSGALLADVSTSNVNVIHEVGLAHGMVRPTFLLARKSTATIPSNLSHLPIIMYAQRQRASEEVLARVARLIRRLWQDYARRIGRTASDYGLSLEDAWPEARPVWSRRARGRRESP